MTTPETTRRLAIAAPLVQLSVGSALLALAARPAELLTAAVVVVLVAPAVIGVWVFRGRPLLHRLLLGAWASAGAVVLFFAILFGMRFLSGGSDAFFWAVVVVPIVALLVLGLTKLRGASRSSWLFALALWVVAIAEAVAAIPLSERFGAVGDMYSLAGTLLLLFAPGIAFGAWSGLALAALVPDGGPKGAPSSEDVAAPTAPGDVVVSEEVS